MDPPDDERRFVIELEFVQCLVNADYLRWLALNKYLEDQAFIDFLKYLQYWKRPDYARFITYPNCLAILDLLQQDTFRAQLVNGYFCDLVDQQQRNHWRFYMNNRRKSTNAAGSSWTLDLNTPPKPDTEPAAMSADESDLGHPQKSPSRW